MLLYVWYAYLCMYVYVGVCLPVCEEKSRDHGVNESSYSAIAVIEPKISILPCLSVQMASMRTHQTDAIHGK